MAKELIINASLPEVRIALMEDGRIQELLIERASDKGIVGNIYKGRVTRVLPGMQAAFVDVGLDKAAFLYVDDIYVHPKVMGEENEVVSDESDDDRESDDLPIQGFQSNVTDEELEQVERSDSSSLESHASEHAENGLTADAVSQEFEAAAHAQMQDDEEEREDDDEMDSESDSESEDFDDEGGENEESEAELQASSENSSETQSVPGGQFAASTEASSEGAPAEGSVEGSAEGSLEALSKTGEGKRYRGRNRKRGRGKGKPQEGRAQFAGGESNEDPENIPEALNESLLDGGNVESDRAAMEGGTGPGAATSAQGKAARKARPEFREQRGRDRRIKSKNIRPRVQANIADLLKEGQEVIVQVGKDPIATKGARLTCHVSLPGRHLVCMPSIDHVGVSRRIERDDERRRLRDYVERHRPRKMGFIVRTASGGKDPESWIKQDIDYLSKLWTEIRTKADDVSAPALVYEDLNSILRAIRDWVNEDIDKIIVDSRYHYNELVAFAERFMPSLLEIIELYQGDVPIFDAYGLSGELNRSLERRVWLKSGGYIVIDQAEALVAIDVNTGRFVGKKNLEDTILKTNLEAAEEIAYQLRLRNCGGIIIVDFIDMERDDNKMRVYRALDEALKQDRARPTIQKISELGLVEMTRKRTRDTIIRTLCEPCTHCEGKGFTKSNPTVAYEILREIERLSVDRDAKKILVSAHETVINILAIEFRDAVDQLERRYNKSVYLQTILDFHSEQFEVVSDRMQGKKQTGDIARQLRVERDRTERKDKQQKSRRQEHSNRSEPRAIEAQDDRENDAPTPRQSAPQAPVPKPSGSFIARPSTIQPTAKTEGGDSIASNDSPQIQASQASDENDGFEQDLDAQPRAPIAPKPRQNGGNHEDEDQLAYLRAQAAQDAAIASLGHSSPVLPGQGGAGGGRNQHRQGQNNNRNNGRQNFGRGQGGGGQGGQQNRNHHNRSNGQNNHRNGAGGNNRFRPQNNRPYGQGGAIEPGNSIVASPAIERQIEAPQIPDYEVLKGSDDGSNS